MSPTMRFFFPAAAEQEKRLRPLLDSMSQEFGVNLNERACEAAKRIAIESDLRPCEEAKRGPFSRRIAMMVL